MSNDAPEKPKDSKSKPLAPLTFDFRSGKPMPKLMQEAIEAHLAIEQEDAARAGNVGYMARALVIATMPYKDPKADSFTRINGDFRLRILAGYAGGIPFGTYPRILMSWVATEAVRTQSPVIELGESLAGFLRTILNVKAGGGARGASTRMSEQMKRLFGSLITAEMMSKDGKRGFNLRNVLIADEADISDDDCDVFDGLSSATNTYDEDGQILWTPQTREAAGNWKSQVRLSNSFFKELIEAPVPIDLRAYKGLRESPLAMDVYTWLSYRMSYTTKKTRPMPWLSLMGQFGSNYSSDDVGQNVRNFKKAFLSALQLVCVVYPEAKVEVHESGLVLLPSETHVPQIKGQSNLFE